jgi:hypothetical protein
MQCNIRSKIVRLHTLACAVGMRNVIQLGHYICAHTDWIYLHNLCTFHFDSRDGSSSPSQQRHWEHRSTSKDGTTCTCIPIKCNSLLEPLTVLELFRFCEQTIRFWNFRYSSIETGQKLPCRWIPLSKSSTTSCKWKQKCTFRVRIGSHPQPRYIGHNFVVELYPFDLSSTCHLNSNTPRDANSFVCVSIRRSTSWGDTKCGDV